MRRPVRFIALGLFGLVVVGAAWLAFWPSQPEMLPVTEGPLGPETLAAARALLAEKGITARQEAGRLLVERRSLKRAQAAMAENRLGRHGGISAFERLAAENDIWSTGAQSARRWQATMMATLSRVISEFSAVHSATVLFEPGSPRRLGSKGSAPTAAVNVRLHPDREMTPTLIAAIADQVSGSIGGLEPQDVRIVDSTGRSYRLGDSDRVRSGRLAEARSREAHYRKKVLEALNYIDNVTVGVHVLPEAADRCVGASICVPRSYLLAIYHAGGDGLPEPDDKTLDKFASPHLERIRMSVTKVIGAEDSSAVRVDWYYDVPAAETALAIAGSDSPGWIVRNARALVCSSMMSLGLMCCVALMLRRKLRRATAARAEDITEVGRTQEANVSPLAMLDSVADEDLVTFVTGEQPQMIAQVLAHLPPDRAAAILARLPAELQVEVARRIASLDCGDIEALSALQRRLTTRFGGEGSEGTGGIEAVAGILQHAGYATEKSVLDGLGGREPTLAESIRRKMFVFEDIALMPARRLGQSLELIDGGELAVALRTAGEDLQRKVLSSLSHRAARRVREEMERIGPVRLSDVEAAQLHVAEAVIRMEYGNYLSAAVGGEGEIVA